MKTYTLVFEDGTKTSVDAYYVTEFNFEPDTMEVVIDFDDDVVAFDGVTGWYLTEDDGVSDE
jgi:hypothetical protein